MADYNSERPCPCGSRHSYSQCCLPLLSGEQQAKEPEQLMRSRFSAFCLQQTDYLIATHHPSFQSGHEQRELEQSYQQTRWLMLDVIDSGQTGGQGWVEFKAYFQQQERYHCLHELSRFILKGQRWFYQDGDQFDTEPRLPRRNDPCWCGSGNKFKKCHG